MTRWFLQQNKKTKQNPTHPSITLLVSFKASDIDHIVFIFFYINSFPDSHSWICFCLKKRYHDYHETCESTISKKQNKKKGRIK